MQYIRRNLIYQASNQCLYISGSSFSCQQQILFELNINIGLLISTIIAKKIAKSVSQQLMLFYAMTIHRMNRIAFVD